MYKKYEKVLNSLNLVKKNPRVWNYSNITKYGLPSIAAFFWISQMDKYMSLVDTRPFQGNICAIRYDYLTEADRQMNVCFSFLVFSFSLSFSLSFFFFFLLFLFFFLLFFFLIFILIIISSHFFQISKCLLHFFDFHTIIEEREVEEMYGVSSPFKKNTTPRLSRKSSIVRKHAKTNKNKNKTNKDSKIQNIRTHHRGNLVSHLKRPLCSPSSYK